MNNKMDSKNSSQIGSGSPLSFTGVLEQYKSLISVIAPYSQGGALRVELAGKLPTDAWKTFAYRGGIFTSNYGGKFTYYVKADKAQETVAQLKAIGCSIPNVPYKGQVVDAPAKVEAKPVAKATAKKASSATKKQAESLIKIADALVSVGIKKQAEALIKMADALVSLGITGEQFAEIVNMRAQQSAKA